MKKVVTGLMRFQQLAKSEHRALLDSLKSGQSPEVLMLTCSDSRIDPNLMTQTRPGELFVCRNAGNQVLPGRQSGDGTAASIEFAVLALGVQHLVVCGHTDCGAIRGAMHPEQLAELPLVRDWALNLRPAVEAARRGGGSEPELDEVAAQNVVLQLANLKSLAAVAKGQKEGRLALHGWMYQTGTGELSCYDEQSGGFVPAARYYADLLP